MKKIIFLLAFTLTFLACSEESEDNSIKNSITQPVQEEQNLDGANSF